MPDPHAMGGLAGQGLLAIACVAAVVVASRLHRETDRQASTWLAWRLAGTVLLVAFAVAVNVFELEQPAGGASDLFVLSAFVLFGAVLLLDVPFHLAHPDRAGLLDDHPWLAYGIVGSPLVGLGYVLFAWPGRAPVTFAEARGDESLMAERMAWSNRYDVVEDAAIFLLVATIALAALALVTIQGWRALRGSRRTRHLARRMLAQAAVGPLVWLVGVGLIAALGMLGVSSLSPALAFASGLLIEPGVPASFLLLGPLLWGRDVLEGEAHRRATAEPSPSANPS